jgi:hypothetical protein
MVSKFGCGKNLFSRSEASKFALSRFDEAKELSKYRRDDI